VEVLGTQVAIVFSTAEAAVISRQLSRTIQRAYGAPGSPPPPRLLLDLASEISAASSARTEPVKFRDQAPVPLCRQPDTLTTRDAAGRAEVSEGFMRRCCRRGDVEASRGHRSAWLVDADSLDAWVSQRRKQQRKAA
jgi:hypothetical protein